MIGGRLRTPMIKDQRVYYDPSDPWRNLSYVREKRYVKPDGTPVWVNMLVSAIKTDDENTFSHLSLIEDITDRKKIEEELKESERSKAVLLSHIPGLAYRCKYDRKWTMSYVSSGSKELTGTVAESFLNNRDLSYNDAIAPPYQMWFGISGKKL
jgi:PAS domain-containing protein